MWRMRRLFQRLGGPARFDLAHQLNPVDAGLSLALADQPVPMVLGPYVPDWPQSGPGSIEAPPSGPRAVKRALLAAQQRNARMVLLSTQAAETKLAVPPSPSTLVRVDPAGDRRRAVVARDAASSTTSRSCCSWPTCGSARASWS